ncbi:MAG: DMT family transporter [Thaumarchaeota archaeon]|nr:DMT family transporter [Nitrososphaerota archaeon]
MDETGQSAKSNPADEESKISSGIIAKLRSYSLLILLSLIWGIAFVAIRRADFELSPVNLAILRWLIASAGYLVILPLIGKPKMGFEKRDLPRLLAISAANVPAYHLSLNYAETTVSSGLAGLLISLGPVFVTILSVYSLKEKVTSRLLLALVLALLGVAVLSVGDLSLGTGGIIGPLEVVITALAYAIFSVLAKPLVKKYGALHVAIWTGVTGTVMLLPLISGNFLTQVSSLSEFGWISILYLSLLSTVLGYSMYYTLVSRTKISKLSIQLFLAPIVSVLGGIVLLGETVTIYTIVGGAIMLSAIRLVMKIKN